MSIRRRDYVYLFKHDLELTSELPFKGGCLFKRAISSRVVAYSNLEY